MAVSTFGVTAAMLRETHFGHLSDFSTVSTPTATVVTSVIERKAARLEGRLRKEGISTADLAAGTSPYLIAQELLLLEAATEVAGMITGGSPELSKSWASRLKDRYEELDEEGWTAVGAVEPDDDPAGPNNHIDAHNLELEDEADISPLTHKLRSSDLL